MKATRTYLLSCALILIGALFTPSLSQAQSRLGVVWDPPSNDVQASNEIAFLQQHATELIILPYPQRAYIRAELERQQMSYIVDASLEFVTESLLEAGRATIQRQISDVMALENSNTAFEGVLLFRHSQTYNTDFITRAQSLIQETGYQDSARFLDRYKDDIRDLLTGETLGTYESYSNPDEHTLLDFTSRITSARGYVIVEYSWLDELMKNFTAVKTGLMEANSLNSAVIPLPEIPDKTPLIHWSVIVLLLIWISFAVNIRLSPTYQETILRYFTSHRFYVDDILSYRERSSISAIFLLFQHALFGGLVAYVMAKSFISEAGLSALYFQLPQLGIMGQNYFSLFVVITLLVLLVELIAIAWLYFPNPNLTHLNQALNLYNWIFHVDFILVSVMVVLFFADASAGMLLTLACIFVLLWFAGFNITALDSSKRLGPARTLYLLKTILLHTLLAAAMIVLIFVFNDWMEVADLIISI